MAARVRVEDDAAAERVRRRQRADHEPVAGGGDDRLLEAQLEEAPAELDEPRRRLARAVMDADPRAAVGPRVGRGPGERDVDAVGGLQTVAVVITSPRATSSRSTPARFSATRWPASARSTGSSWTSMPRTRAVFPPGSSGHRGALLRDARPQRAGDDRPGAADAEDAVDVQAQRARSRTRGHPRRGAGQRRRAARPAPRRCARRPARSPLPAATAAASAAARSGDGEVGLRHRDHALASRRARPAPRRARASGASRRRRRRRPSGTGRSRSRPRPSCARSARGRARRRRSAAVRPAASGA